MCTCGSGVYIRQAIHAHSITTKCMRTVFHSAWILDGRATIFCSMVGFYSETFILVFGFIC